jgi:hypothetical protein
MNPFRVNKSLDELQKIEDDPVLFDFVCPSTGLLIWPLIRVPVMRTIMDSWFAPKTFTSRTSTSNIWKLAMSGAVSSIRNLDYRLDTSRKILIQSTGWGRYSREGVLHDRLVDYFSGSFPEQTLVYQDKPVEKFSDIYSYNPTIYKAPRNIIYGVLSIIAVRSTHRNLANRLVKRIVDNAKNRLGFEFSNDQIIRFRTMLSRRLAGLPYISESYAKLFSMHSFKLLLKEDACYGGGSIPVIHAARLNSMVIAEYQHGAILKGHDAYNVSGSLANFDPFKKVLPDYLLTYGKWWSDQTNLPVKKIAIGNPHYTESVNCQVPTVIKKAQVLVLGDGIETNAYFELARNISNFVCGMGMNVVFRPHPFERGRVNSDVLPNSVQLDLNEDIYASLKESSVVVSELSTGLFEAVGLADKVLLWETERSRFAFPEIPFMSFSSMDELEAILKDTHFVHGDSGAVPVSEMWEPDWKQNYLHFVEGVIGQ